MEIVLGVSMTPTTVRLVLVEGENADGLTVDHDVFGVTAIDSSATASASNQVVDAILGTRESAVSGGHRLLTTGVAWSDRAEAAAMREALIARGIDDVVLASELHAAGALAQAIGRTVGSSGSSSLTAATSEVGSASSNGIINPPIPVVVPGRQGATELAWEIATV